MLHVGVGNGGGEMAAASNAETEYIVPGLDRPYSMELDSNTQQEQCDEGTVAFHMVHVGMGDGGGEIHYTNKNARMTQGEDTRTLAPASMSETEYIRLGDLDSPHAKDGESAVLFLAALQWKYTKVETEVADEMEKVVWNYFTTSSGVLWIQWNLRVEVGEKHQLQAEIEKMKDCVGQIVGTGVGKDMEPDITWRRDLFLVALRGRFEQVQTAWWNFEASYKGQLCLQWQIVVELKEGQNMLEEVKSLEDQQSIKKQEHCTWAVGEKRAETSKYKAGQTDTKCACTSKLYNSGVE
ncbi:uncharacterized protein C8R40DRAFT_1074483 [Lentinula edodes]|uniref:uncharacterized protein n=1 Tax=Lentinula edodes TaxID=5353 RepID=UPI001E8E797C|nr:uncharacterized protein C8R40DRAFT_1074483 [Lentinula edodes]KAH7868868.1 hypothetical protein C8R40DRAFT_1074483 [Lentinula edodes]